MRLGLESRYENISFFFQMWLPEVNTCRPAPNNSPALFRSTPIPPAAFSALAMAKSIFSSLTSDGRSPPTARRAGRPMTSPKIRTRIVQSSRFKVQRLKIQVSGFETLNLEPGTLNLFCKIHRTELTDNRDFDLSGIRHLV